MDRYRKVIAKYVKLSSGALVVFDVTSRESFENIAKWITELQNKTDVGLCVIIVGNKTDLKEQRVVTTEEAEKYAKANGFQYLETSALTDDGIKEGFINLANEIYKITYEGDGLEDKKNTVSVHINNDDNNDQNEKKPSNIPSTNDKQVAGCGCIIF